MTALLLAGCWACCLLDCSALRLPGPPRSPIQASYSFSISHTGNTGTAAAATWPSRRRFTAPRWNPVASERRTPATTSSSPQTTAAPETPVPETPEHDVQPTYDSYADFSTLEVPVPDDFADDSAPVIIPELPQSDASAPDISVPDVLIPNEQEPEVPITKAPAYEFPYYEFYEEQDYIYEPQNAAPSAPALHSDNEKSIQVGNLVEPAETPSSESVSPELLRQAEYSFKTVFGR